MSAKLREIRYTFETNEGALDVSRDADDYLRIEMRGEEEVCVHVEDAGALIRTVARLCNITSLDVEEEL